MQHAPLASHAVKAIMEIWYRLRKNKQQNNKSHFILDWVFFSLFVFPLALFFTELNMYKHIWNLNYKHRQNSWIHTLLQGVTSGYESNLFSSLTFYSRQTHKLLFVRRMTHRSHLKVKTSQKRNAKFLLFQSRHYLLLPRVPTKISTVRWTIKWVWPLCVPE